MSEKKQSKRRDEEAADKLLSIEELVNDSPNGQQSADEKGTMTLTVYGDGVSHIRKWGRFWNISNPRTLARLLRAGNEHLAQVKAEKKAEQQKRANQQQAK